MQRLTQIALLAALATSLAAGLLAPLPAQAGEGATSIGHGVKCRWTLDANNIFQWVCRKGV